MHKFYQGFMFEIRKAGTGLGAGPIAVGSHVSEKITENLRGIARHFGKARQSIELSGRKSLLNTAPQ